MVPNLPDWVLVAFQSQLSGWEMNSQPNGSRSVRTLFVSDVHLGDTHSQAHSFLTFLREVQPETLYLVGDFIEARLVHRLLNGRGILPQIFQRLAQLSDQGVKICYAPGNHDAFLRSNTQLREILTGVDSLVVEDEFLFETADGKRLLVTHGDQFDTVERWTKLSYFLAEVIYQSMLWGNRFLHLLFRIRDRSPYSKAGRLMRWLKRAIGFQDQFISRLLRYAEEAKCDGVICGHIHTPTISQHGSQIFCNTGDWIENCTALVEEFDGSLRLVYFYPNMHPGNCAEPTFERTPPFKAIVSP